MLDRLTMILSFLKTRYYFNFRSRLQLLEWQKIQLNRLLNAHLKKSPYYKEFSGNPLSSLPIVDKAEVIRSFSGMNTVGINYEEAIKLTIDAEQSRNFSPTLHGITIGLSSGTSGNRGLFMASKKESNVWAGILLARMLSKDMLIQILQPWAPPLKIAFFLRANSNAYDTINSKRVDFIYYDLFIELDKLFPELENQQPEVLVAPANVLKIIAQKVMDGIFTIKPKKIISVAEVLERDDAELIEYVFGSKPHQIYQATEGFLGYTCQKGMMHLNETFVHFEFEWLDETHTRFHPIITDFTRKTQMIVRYRLNDILKLSAVPCLCGSAELTIEGVEGRADDILWFADVNKADLKPIFPDFIRRAMMLAEKEIEDYRVIQNDQLLSVELKASNFHDASSKVSLELKKLWKHHEVTPPATEFLEWTPLPLHTKRRRIYCKTQPSKSRPTKLTA